MLASITRSLHLSAYCIICKQNHDNHLAICQICLPLIKKINNPCRGCALPLPDSDDGFCGRCLRSKPLWDSIHCHYVYQEPLSTLIKNFKFKEQLFLAPTLASLMLDAIPDINLNLTCLIPIPMHPEKMRVRGYNQSLVLAKQLQTHLKLPLKPDILERIKKTSAQSGLKAKSRADNVKAAFMAHKSRFKEAILIDDLITTGHTAQEAVKTLKQAGFEKVDLWCCARAILD